jgi:dihydrofolate reductase
VPVFVLTHIQREPIPMKGGTVFRFLSASPPEAPSQATALAGGQDVRIGGGASTVREFLKAGLVDDLHVAVVPIILGRGIRLWDDLRGLETEARVLPLPHPAASFTSPSTARETTLAAGHRTGHEDECVRRNGGLEPVEDA